MDLKRGEAWSCTPTAGHDRHGQSAVYRVGSGRDIAIVYDGKAHGNLIAAVPDLLEALQLDVVFHSRPFARDSIEEFRASGYRGPIDANSMRAFLWEKKRSAIAKAEEV